jgi:hypothetical protein
MVDAFVVRLIQSANRAPAGILIQNFYFGCHTGDEDHVQRFNVQSFRVLPLGFSLLAAGQQLGANSHLPVANAKLLSV